MSLSAFKVHAATASWVIAQDCVHAFPTKQLIAGQQSELSYEDCLCSACRLAAERGAVEAAGPGSLRVGLLDNLYQLAEAVGSSTGSEASALRDGLKITRQQSS